ncbi:MAG: UDP-N-acetylmuramoyl-L-alanyl-D-glutamate--2,6-diaminopimelate ligase, partial [Chloroflexi bacterium]|nr:UDP-N-acetylmuramoyl-L-alanyl-D-glutamate--2,6-diaminopimelate ligase [Chloroflexota bacterium]
QSRPAGQLDVEITGLACDSRRVQPGDLFVAVPGVDVDGHSFIPAALQRGAVAVVGQRPASEVFAHGSPVPYIAVADSRQALGWLAAMWHGYPARKLRVIGVTGSEGKTTTVRLIASILQAAGHRIGWVSTVSAVIGGEEVDTGLHTTTPDALEMQGYLAHMVDAAAEYAVIEATSHGLAQHRVTGCEFDVAVVTTITHEHMDYHKTYEEYRAAKARLFASLSDSYRKPGVAKVSILNADDTSYDFLEQYTAERCLSYGIERPSDVVAQEIHASAFGTSFTALTSRGTFEVMTPLIGAYNVYNILAAIAVGVSQGTDVAAMQRGIAAVKGVTGRMERIDMGQDFTAIIDFAHTPNSLEKALLAVRDLTHGRVIVVFGCAGLRDRAKRPWMGEIAGRLADYTILTAEDPRTEDVNEIIEEIAEGCRRVGRREGRHFHSVPDRTEAIQAAINLARPGDLVIVAGKGHEQSMCYGTTEHPWSEHEALRTALRRRLGIAS